MANRPLNLFNKEREYMICYELIFVYLLTSFHRVRQPIIVGLNDENRLPLLLRR